MAFDHSTQAFDFCLVPPASASVRFKVITSERIGHRMLTSRADCVYEALLSPNKVVNEGRHHIPRPMRRQGRTNRDVTAYFPHVDVVPDA